MNVTKDIQRERSMLITRDVLSYFIGKVKECSETMEGR